jgi:hypothetical protein
MKIINLKMLSELLEAYQGKQQKFIHKVKRVLIGDPILKELERLHEAATRMQRALHRRPDHVWLSEENTQRYINLVTKAEVLIDQSPAHQVFFAKGKEATHLNSVLAGLNKRGLINDRILRLLDACDDYEPVAQAVYALYFLSVEEVRVSDMTHMLSHSESSRIIVECFHAFQLSANELQLRDCFMKHYAMIGAAVDTYAKCSPGELSRYEDVAHVSKFFGVLVQIREYGCLDVELLRCFLYNIEHAKSLYIGIKGALCAGELKGTCKQMLIQHPSKAKYVGAILRELPTDEHVELFKRIDLANFSDMRLRCLHGTVKRLNSRAMLSVDKFKNQLLDAPTLTLNGQSFDWRLFKHDGEGYKQAKREALAFRAHLKRNNGMFPQVDDAMDEEMDEDSFFEMLKATGVM